MTMVNRMISALPVAGGVAMALACVGSASAAEQPAAARYYAFLGHWKGQGQLTETSKKPIALKLRVVCRKAASGWAVRCDMKAKNGALAMSEADLMGVDAVTGKGHW